CRACVCRCSVQRWEGSQVRVRVWGQGGVSPGASVSGWLGVYRGMDATLTQHLLPLTSLQPGERTNVDEAKRILRESGLPITAAENLEDAAKKAVAAIRK
ncbi:hypothetical protein JOQ06_014513, partial [Pogonophryne albipinna]